MIPTTYRSAFIGPSGPTTLFAGFPGRNDHSSTMPPVVNAAT